MGFKVHSATGYDTFEDGISYNFNEAGLLVVHLGHDGGRLTYSPHAWTVVEEPDGAGKCHRQSGRFSQADANSASAAGGCRFRPARRRGGRGPATRRHVLFRPHSLHAVDEVLATIVEP